MDGQQQELWNLVLAKVDEIEREKRTRGSRSAAWVSSNGLAVMAILDLPVGDGTHEVFRIEAQRAAEWMRKPPTVTVARSYHSAEPFWENRIAKNGTDPGRVVVVDGIHYWLGKNGNRPSPHNGFGGSRYEIAFHDGRHVVTHDLWYQGPIPPKFREQLPDNARFVTQTSA